MMNVTPTEVRESRSTLVHFKDLAEHRPGVPVIFCPRVSTQDQKLNGNLTDQLRRMREKADRYGSPVIAEYPEVGDGKKIRRPKVIRAVRLARRTEAVVVFEDLTRMLRSGKFHPKRNPNAQASDAKIERFLRIHHGVVFALIDDPHATVQKIKRMRTKRGQKAKGNTGGGDNRPGKMVRRRRRLLPRAIKLSKRGWSFRQIGEHLEIAPMVACEWWHKREVYGFSPDSDGTSHSAST